MAREPAARSSPAADRGTIGGVAKETKGPRHDRSDPAAALRKRVADWRAGAEEAKALDRRISREQSTQERLDSGRDLVELAAKLRRRE
jgi:hypothetical protein